jgi:hypothetical protein
MSENGKENPRALWILGGLKAWAPPPHGGDTARAMALYQQGLAAARREALQAEARPAWAPAWGAPELLMSLGYLHAHATPPNRELAQAYLDGALAAVPHWRYVAEVLRPQVEGMATPAPTAAAAPSK